MRKLEKAGSVTASGGGVSVPARALSQFENIQTTYRTGCSEDEDGRIDLCQNCLVMHTSCPPFNPKPHLQSLEDRLGGEHWISLSLFLMCPH